MNDLNALFTELKKIIDLPDDCKKIVLTLEVGAVPVVEVTQYVLDAHATAPITRRFSLREIEGTDAKLSQGKDDSAPATNSINHVSVAVLKRVGGREFSYTLTAISDFEAVSLAAQLCLQKVKEMAK